MTGTATDAGEGTGQKPSRAPYCGWSGHLGVAGLFKTQRVLRIWDWLPDLACRWLGHNVTASLPRRDRDGPARPRHWHPSSAQVPPPKGAVPVIPEDGGWRVLPSICGAQKDRYATGRVSLALVSHISGHYQSMGLLIPPHRDPNQKRIMHKNNRHQKLCKTPLLPHPLKLWKGQVS